VPRVGEGVSLGRVDNEGEAVDVGGKGVEVGVAAPLREGVDCEDRVPPPPPLSRSGVEVKVAPKGALGDTPEVGVEPAEAECREEGEEEGVGAVGELLGPLDAVAPPTCGGDAVGVGVECKGVGVGDPDRVPPPPFPPCCCCCWGLPLGVEVGERLESRDEVPPPTPPPPPPLVPLGVTEAVPPAAPAPPAPGEVGVALGLEVEPPPMA
jgi:hypothetical protein